MLSLTEKVIFEAILRFKTLENGEIMKLKCKNQVPQMQFWGRFSKGIQQNGKQEKDDKHGFSKN